MCCLCVSVCVCVYETSMERGREREGAGTLGLRAHHYQRAWLLFLSPPLSLSPHTLPSPPSIHPITVVGAGQTQGRPPLYVNIGCTRGPTLLLLLLLSNYAMIQCNNSSADISHINSFHNPLKDTAAEIIYIAASQ